MHNNTTVSKYFDAITAEAQKAKDAAEQMYKEYKSTRISEYKKQVKEESNREIGRRTSVIRQNIGKEYSIKETELRKQIFVKREEIFNNVFEEAKNELIEYANSSEYEAFIESSIIKGNEIYDIYVGTVLISDGIIIVHTISTNTSLVPLTLSFDKTNPANPQIKTSEIIFPTPTKRVLIILLPNSKVVHVSVILCHAYGNENSAGKKAVDEYIS